MTQTKQRATSGKTPVGLNDDALDQVAGGKFFSPRQIGTAATAAGDVKAATLDLANGKTAS